MGDDVDFDEVRMGDHARSLGIELTVGPGNLWRPECNLSSEDPVRRKAGLAWHRKNLSTAHG